MMRGCGTGLEAPTSCGLGSPLLPSSSQHFCMLPAGSKGHFSICGPWSVSRAPGCCIQSLSSPNLHSRCINVGCGAVPNAQLSCGPAAPPERCLGKRTVASHVPDSQGPSDVATTSNPFQVGPVRGKCSMWDLPSRALSPCWKRKAVLFHNDVRSLLCPVFLSELAFSPGLIFGTILWENFEKTKWAKDYWMSF